MECRKGRPRWGRPETAEKSRKLDRWEERELPEAAPSGAFRSTTAAESGGTWRGGNPGRVPRGELPQSGKRWWPGPFVFNHKFFGLFKGSKNLLSASKRLFRHAEAGPVGAGLFDALLCGFLTKPGWRSNPPTSPPGGSAPQSRPPSAAAQRSGACRCSCSPWRDHGRRCRGSPAGLPY